MSQHDAPTLVETWSEIPELPVLEKRPNPGRISQAFWTSKYIYPPKLQEFEAETHALACVYTQLVM